MPLRKRGKIWYIDFYAHGRRVRECIGENKALAEVILKKRAVEVAEGKYLDIRKQEKIRFSDFVDMYLELHSKPHKRSYKTDKSHARSLKAYFGKLYIQDITPLLVEKYKIKRSRESSTATANRHLAMLKHIFTKAIEWGKTDKSPIASVQLFKERPGRLRYLEKEEIERLLSNCTGNMKAIVMLAIHTGMRKGEILELKWQDLDFKHGIINIYYTKNYSKKEVPMNSR
jgi:integrase